MAEINLVRHALERGFFFFFNWEMLIHRNQKCGRRFVLKSFILTLKKIKVIVQMSLTDIFLTAVLNT